MEERIQKVLSAIGLGSRRAIEQMVLDGRIAVNGKLAFSLPVMVEPATDRITVDDRAVDIRAKEQGPAVYVLMHKPKNVFSTNVAQGEQKRAIDLLPPDMPRVYPVGRLDADSTGLLLLTNDGELTHRLTHPKFGVPKTYSAVVLGHLSDSDLERVMKGVWLGDWNKREGVKTGRSFVKIVQRLKETTVVELTLREGKNRQVRRMFAAIGHKVRQLTRVKLGPLTLKGLGPGQWRTLTVGEIRALYDVPNQEKKRFEAVQELKAERVKKRAEKPVVKGASPQRPPRRDERRPAKRR